MSGLEWTGFRRSVSQRRTYRDCGLKWYFNYGAGWQRQKGKAYFIIGHAWQDTINAVLLHEKAPQGWSPAVMRRKPDGSPDFDLTRCPLSQARDFFLSRWAPYEGKADQFDWPSKMNWAAYRDRYAVLCEKHLGPRIIEHLELPSWAMLDAPLHFKLGDVEEVGYPDYYGVCSVPEQVVKVDGKDVKLPALARSRRIVDFKTAGRVWDYAKVENDEQFTDYQIGVEQLADAQPMLGLPPVEGGAYCVAVHTTNPQIQWLPADRRTDEQVAAHIHSAQVVDAQIKRGEFPANYGACFTMGKCDFAALCYGSQKAKIGAELARKDPKKVRHQAVNDTSFLSE